MYVRIYMYICMYVCMYMYVCSYIGPFIYTSYIFIQNVCDCKQIAASILSFYFIVLSQRVAFSNRVYACDF